jgi:hypothetical protein
MRYDLLTYLDKTLFNSLPLNLKILQSEFDSYTNANANVKCASKLALKYGVKINEELRNYGEDDQNDLHLLKILLMFLSKKGGLNIEALKNKNYNPEKLKGYKNTNSGTLVLPKIYDTKEELEGFFKTRARGEYEEGLSTNPDDTKPKINYATAQNAQAAQAAQNAQRQGTAVAGTKGGSHPQKKTHKCSDGVTRTVYTINGKRYVKRKSPKTNTYIYVKI